MVPRRDVWIAYLLMACQGFLFYGVGFLTPYVEAELGAPTWASALGNSAMAVGLLGAAVAVPRVVRALGDWGAVRLWALMMSAAAVLMAVGASMPAMLLGAFITGIAGAGALTHSVTAFAGRRNGVLLMRATLASVVGGVLGPLVLSTAARSIGWNWGPLAVVPLALALAAAATVVGRDHARTARADHEPVPPVAGSTTAIAPEPTTGTGPAPTPGPSRDGRTEPGLPGAYWITWLFLVLCIGAEMSFVAWGAQVAVAQAGMALADATALGSLFILGEIVGRILLGVGGGTSISPRRLLGGMVLMGIAGGILIWLGQAVVIAGAGLLLGGLGLAGVWATSAGVAVAQAPASPVTAGARLNLASGVAIVSAPLVLGLVAQGAGVVAAWMLVIGLLAIALAVLRVVPAPRTAS